MNLRKQINQLKRLHFFIEFKSTGSPAKLASRLEISEATLYRYLNELKLDGAEIKYDKWQESYYYQNDYVLKF